jgi:hypothetical protein
MRKKDLKESKEVRRYESRIEWQKPYDNQGDWMLKNLERAMGKKEVINNEKDN